MWPLPFNTSIDYGSNEGIFSLLTCLLYSFKYHDGNMFELHFSVQLSRMALMRWRAEMFRTVDTSLRWAGDREPDSVRGQLPTEGTARGK